MFRRKRDENEKCEEKKKIKRKKKRKRFITKCVERERRKKGELRKIG